MEKQSHLYEDENERIFTLLVERVWVQLIEPTAGGSLIVSTTDSKAWNIHSALDYARLLYLYERDQA